MAMMSLRGVPETVCPHPGVQGDGHYVPRERMRDNDVIIGEPVKIMWGQCLYCDRIVAFEEYQLHTGVTMAVWTDYHHPIIEWP